MTNDGGKRWQLGMKPDSAVLQPGLPGVVLLPGCLRPGRRRPERPELKLRSKEQRPVNGAYRAIPQPGLPGVVFCRGVYAPADAPVDE